MSVKSESKTGLSVGKPYVTHRLLPRLGAEFFGTFMVVLVGVGYGVLANPSESPLLRAAAFGFALVGAMFVFAPISGGHLNPAVTLGVGVSGRMPLKDVPAYIVAQVAGGVAGVAVLFFAFMSHPQLQDVSGIIRNSGNGFDQNSPAQFPLTSVLLIEVVATAILVAVYLGIGQRKRVGNALPLGVGLSYLALLAFLLPLDQGGLNPARSTAVALFGLDWAVAQLWLFWVAPLVGALIAGLLFRALDLSAAVARNQRAAERDEADADADADAEEAAVGAAGAGTEGATVGATEGAGGKAAGSEVIAEDITVGRRGDTKVVTEEVVAENGAAAKKSKPSKTSGDRDEVQDFFDKK